MKLSPKRRRILGMQFWFLVLKGSFIQRAVAEKLIQLGDSEELFQTTIKYKSKDILGFLIGQKFPIFEWLVDNHDLEGFEAYHADFRDGPWEKSRLDEKTSAERMRNEPIAQQLREKLTEPTSGKSATVFKQRYPTIRK